MSYIWRNESGTVYIILLQNIEYKLKEQRHCEILKLLQIYKNDQIQIYVEMFVI